MTKKDYALLGLIKHFATNGLSVYENGKESGQISGGAIGDAVVKELGSAAIKIIPASEWVNMPANEEEASKPEQTVDIKKLQSEVAQANKRADEYKAKLEKAQAEILDLKDDLQKANDESLNLRGLLEKASSENLELETKLATNKKGGKGDKDKDATPVNEERSLIEE